MASASKIVAAVLCFVSAVVGTPLIVRQDQLLSPPANITFSVISHSDRVAPAVQLQDDGLYLAVTYTNLAAETDVAGRLNNDISTVKLKVGYPEGYAFEIHDPKFQANVSLAERAVAQFQLYTSFGDTPVTISGVSFISGRHKGEFSVLTKSSLMSTQSRYTDQTSAYTRLPSLRPLSANGDLLAAVQTRPSL